jgi:uroporphyrinogen decarboxylase
LTSRERVLRALTRDGLPDRVPLQFDLCRELLETLGRKHGIPVHITPSWFEDVTWRISGNELRVVLGSDCVVVGAGLPMGYAHAVGLDGTVVNELGMRMRQGPLYMEICGNPLAHATESAEVEAFAFADPLARGRYDDAQEMIARYKDTHFVVGDIEVTIFALARHLVGTEKLLMDMAVGEPMVDCLLDRCLEFTTAMGRRLVELGVDGIWAGDDFGGQQGLLISPAMWRAYFKERYRRLYAEMKAVNPRVLIMQHSDGAIAPILGDWIDAGMQVFNPVQPGVPGHDPAELKGRFGDRLAFWGAVDQQRLLPFGSPAEIEADVRSKIAILGRGGGYMIAPAHIIQADTPVENVEAFIGAALRHGRY